MKIVRGEGLKGFPLFEGTSGKIVFSSDKMMFLLVSIEPGGVVPMHSHPHEQMGVCLKGRAEFESDGEKEIVEEGNFYWFKPGEMHSVKALGEDSCLFLDVFSPPREDYIERAKEILGT